MLIFILQNAVSSQSCVCCCRRQHRSRTGGQPGSAGGDHWLPDSETLLRPHVSLLFPKTPCYSWGGTGSRVRTRFLSASHPRSLRASSCNYELKVDSLTFTKYPTVGHVFGQTIFLFFSKLYQVLFRSIGKPLLHDWQCFYGKDVTFMWSRPLRSLPGITRFMPWTIRICDSCGTGPNTSWPSCRDAYFSTTTLNCACLRSARWRRSREPKTDSRRATSRRSTETRPHVRTFSLQPLLSR